jgi:teichuronic acid biosynthesis glycosyltransferase TuaC
MRILVITHNFPHKEDPTCGIFVARQLCEMVRQGVEVTVMVPIVYAPEWIHRLKRYRYFSPTRYLFQYEGIHSFVVPYLRPPGRPFPFGKLFFLWDAPSAYLSCVKKVKKRHVKNPFDIILGRGLWIEADIGLRLGRKLNLPVIGIGMGDDVNVLPTYGKLFRRRFEKIVRHLDAVLATGQGVADKITDVVGKPTPVIGGVVDFSVFAPPADKMQVREELGLEKDMMHLLFVGHLIKGKGIYELLNVFENLVKKQDFLRLNVCGNGVEEDSVFRIIQQKNLQNHVHLAGDVVPEQMHKWMQAADIFVLPTYNEGMPNVVMEAMGSGLPIITTAVGGLPAAVGDCRGVILIPPRQEKDLQQALDKVLSSESLRKEMAQASRECAVDKFEIKKNTARVLQYIEQAVNEFKMKQSNFPK